SSLDGIMADDSSYENEVVMLIGLPCSGKSTIRDKYPNHGVLSWDDTMESMTEGATYGEKFKNCDDKKVRQELNNQRNRLISEKKDVIIDMTNLTRKSRRKRLNPFPASYKRKAIVCLAGMDTIYKRNEERKEVGKYIDRHVFKRMMKYTYPACYDEFDEIEWILN
ncbi:MAG: ATP-binding protein, partial [Nitrososphaeraceae archaeon]|nr:ATP-binding protein [Nitrososphaeraceae archaeon]